MLFFASFISIKGGKYLPWKLFKKGCYKDHKFCISIPTGQFSLKANL